MKPDRDKLLPLARALKAQGQSLREIGRQIGVSHVALRKWPLDLVDGESPEVAALVASARDQMGAVSQRTSAGEHDWLAGVASDIKALRALAARPGVDPALSLMALQSAAEIGLTAWRLTSQLRTLLLGTGDGHR